MQEAISAFGGSTQTQTHAPPHVKKSKFRTVLGFSAISANSSSSSSSSPYTRSAQLTASTVTERRSIDVSSSGTYFVSLNSRKKRSRNDRGSVTDISFFKPTTTTPTTTTTQSTSTAQTPSRPVHIPLAKYTNKMTKALEVPGERASRRKMARMEAQDGPWSVSVAETPYDKSSYSIYIKSESMILMLFFSCLFWAVNRCRV